jgi:lipocalin
MNADDADFDEKEYQKDGKTVWTVLVILLALIVIIIIVVIFFVSLNGGFSAPPKIPFAASVDGQKLKAAGTYYLIAYTPTSFNNGCENLTHLFNWTFRFDANGNLIQNQNCSSAVTGTINKSVISYYYPNSSGSFAFNFPLAQYIANPAKFTTNNVFAQDMWFMSIDPSYTWFVAATPSKNNFWIASTSKTPSCALLNSLIALVRYNGFPMSKMVFQPGLLVNGQPCV